jgi:hypothetical protein
MVHGVRSAKTKRTSCENCVRQKIKCSRSIPCDSCSSRGLSCDFEQPPNSPQTRPEAHSRDTIEGRNSGSTSLHNQSDAVPSSENVPTDLSPELQLAQNQYSTVSQSLPYAVESVAQPDAYSSLLETDLGLPDLSTEQIAITGLEEGSQSMRRPNQPLDVYGSHEDLNWNGFGTWGIDWLSGDQLLPRQTAEPQFTHVPFGQSMDALTAAAFAEAARLADNSCSGVSQSGNNMRDLLSAPADQTASHVPGVMQSTLQGDMIQQTTETIRSALRGQQLPPDMDSAALRHLERMVSTFFTEFYPGLPVMHPSSWDITACPTYLIAAIACLGSTKLHGKKGSDQDSVMLAEVCSRHLNDLVSDARSRRAW